MKKSVFLFSVLLTAISAFQLSGENETRTWTSKTGKTLEARYVKTDRGQVTLQKADGAYITINESGLSVNDREYISMIIKKENEEKNASAAQGALEKLGLKIGQQVVTLPESVAKDNKVVSSEYLLYLPKGYGVPGEKWPLLLFLHGAGERGSEIKKVEKHGPPKILSKKDLPFVVVSPQCKTEAFWGGPEIMELVEHIQSMLSIDEKRLYITGLSMGGFGTWSTIVDHPDKFAAAIPICGGAPGNKAESVKNMPIWSFHGDSDTTVPMDREIEMVENLKKLKSKDFKFTVYEGCGHDAWTRTYDNEEIYTWLLKFSK